MRHAPFKRAERVGEEIRKTIGRLLTEGIVRDARLNRCTITGVKLSDDLKNAQIFFSLIGGPEDQAQALRLLNRASGFIKTEVGRRLKLRHTPEMRFTFDSSMENAARLENIFQQLREKGELKTDELVELNEADETDETTEDDNHD